jgi:glycosyltransferase involved in cell wall biosynthesis
MPLPDLPDIERKSCLMSVSKIAVLCPGYGIVSRGVETYIEEMVNRLSKNHSNWKFDIFCRARSRRISESIQLIHVPAIDRNGGAAATYARIGHRVGYFFRSRIDAECLSFTMALAPRILRSEYDIIFNQAGPFAGHLLEIKRRRDGTPFIHKTASGYGDLELMMAKQRPDAILATSPFVESWLQDRISDVSVHCLPNGVEPAIFHPYSSQEWDVERENSASLGLSHPIILFAGTMDPMKRPALLLSAMSRLDDCSLLMVGSGILTDRICEEGLRLLGPKRFRLFPGVSHERMPFFYNICDLFTLPSEEPFGISFIEAMACNKPVLSHESPVQRWIFGSAGRTCNCEDPDEYAAAIRSMLATDFGDSPLSESRRFEWGRISSQAEKIFTSTMRADRR